MRSSATFDAKRENCDVRHGQQPISGSESQPRKHSAGHPPLRAHESHRVRVQRFSGRGSDGFFVPASAGASCRRDVGFLMMRRFRLERDCVPGHAPQM